MVKDTVCQVIKIRVATQKKMMEFFYCNSSCDINMILRIFKMEIGFFCSRLLKILCEFLVPTFKNKGGNKTFLYLGMLNYCLFQWHCSLFTLMWEENRVFILCVSWFVLIFNININVFLIVNSFSLLKFSFH